MSHNKPTSQPLVSEENHCLSGLKFFGKICAGISHDLKNNLATINEHNGLLEDLIMISAKTGQPIDPGKISRVVQAVSDHVQKADTILKRMNRFAHSVDRNENQVELEELADQVVSLGHRIADAKLIKVNLKIAEKGINIRTSPFRLQQLLTVVFANACQVLEPRSELDILVYKTDKNAVIEFGSACIDLDEPALILCRQLGIDLTETAEKTVRVEIPRKLDHQ